MRLNDGSAQRQSNPETFGLGGGERKKAVFQKMWRKAWPIVSDADLDEISTRFFSLDQDGAAFVAAPGDRFNRIAQKIDHDLLDLQQVDHDRRKVRGEGGFDRHMEAVE